jgi:hypothetical protein
MKSKPIIYYSHPIAGVNKPDESYSHEDENCLIAIENIRWMRKVFTQVDWYCPGEVEIPMQTARKLHFLTIDQVLEIDFHIIKNKCHGGLLHSWETSIGLSKEKIRLEEFEYPHTEVNQSKLIWECDLHKIDLLIKDVLRFYKERNRK